MLVSYWLFKLLGVLNVFVYRSFTIPSLFSYTKQRLIGLHPNVMVQRSPSHFQTGTFYWAHVGVCNLSAYNTSDFGAFVIILILIFSLGPIPCIETARENVCN